MTEAEDTHLTPAAFPFYVGVNNSLFFWSNKHTKKIWQISVGFIIPCLGKGIVDYTRTATVAKELK